MHIDGFRSRAIGLLFLLALLPRPAAAQDAGRIIGRVTEPDSVTGIAGAQIYLPSIDAGVITAQDGRFVIGPLQPGAHTVRALMLGYADAEAIVQLEPGGTASVQLTLAPAAIEIEALTVEVRRSAGSAVALDTERRDASVVQDAIGQEQIERSSDGDAAAVVARSPGVTVVGGKYVYVRGLGDRYGSATLNGAPLPTPEPDRKTVPLDLIPSNFLESVVTAKTYSPEQPGDYAGGLVQLRTRGYPQFGLFEVTGSLGYDSEATFGNGIAYAGSLDALGRPGASGLPDAIARDVEVRPGTYTPDQLEGIGESFGSAWGPSAFDLPANRALGVTLGDSWSVGADQRRIGFLATGSWSNAYRNRTGEVERVFASGGAAEPEVDYLGTTSTQTVSFGGMAEVAYEPGDEQRVAFTGVFNRTADDQARQLDGFVLDANANLRNYRRQYLAQTMASAQLAGEHALGRVAVDWRADLRYAGRDEPDTREVLYVQGADGVYRWENFIQSGSVFHQTLDELGGGGGIDLSLPFDFGHGSELRFGASTDVRARDVYTRRFRFTPQRPLDAATRELAPDQLFSARHIAPDSFQIQEATFAGDNYDAGQQVHAAYAMAEWSPLERLRLSGGARVEIARQRVDPADLFGTGSAPGSAEADDTDVLPALNVTWSLTDAMNLRFGASQTLARPQFRELAPFGYADYAGGHLVRGNPILERSTIRNLDARWEWFPDHGAVLAVSGFAKRFAAPIEVLVFQQGAELAKTWVNADEAHNYGLELEARADLGFAADALAGLSVNANLTFVRSEVRTDEPARVALPDVGTIAFDVGGSSRALQGQSPYVLNLGAAWQHQTIGTSASVLFNRFGRRIESVGVQPLPDIYEEARNSLDVVIRQRIGDRWSLKLAAERLIGGPVEFTQGGDLLRSWDSGRLFTLSVSLGGGE